MNISIIGPGAMGTTFAYLLMKQGHNVTLLAKERQSAALFRQQYTIVLNGKPLKVLIPADSSPEALQSSELILLFVKAYATDRVMSDLSKRIPSTAKVLTLQNGFDNYENIIKYISPEQVLVGTTSTGAYKKNSSTTVIAGIGDIVIDNTYPEISAVFSHITDKLITTEAPLLAVWKKGIINACINPIAALTDMKNGDLINNKYTKNLQSELVNECVTVAQKEGYDIKTVTMLQDVVHVCRQTSGNRCSMLQDYQAGRKTEIDHINGYILKRASFHNCPVPFNTTLYSLIKASD